MKLQDAPNIGTVLAGKLAEAGIKDIQTLVSLGSQQAFIRLKTVDANCCLNILYALEGAIQGVRWHHLEKMKKEELRNFYQSFQLK